MLPISAFEPRAWAASPLEKVISSTAINRLIGRIRESYERRAPLAITPREIRRAQHLFDRAIRRGEENLHRLALAILRAYYHSEDVVDDLRLVHEIHARCSNPEHPALRRFLLAIELERFQVQSEEQMLERLDLRCERCGARLDPAASFIRYIPMRQDLEEGMILWLSTRVKATADLCQKICDRVFQVERLLLEDKISNQVTYLIKDIYGMKIITQRIPACYRVAEAIEGMEEVELRELKDYIRSPKQSGYRALKLVIDWHGQYFEIQAQTRRMYQNEVRSIKTSHLTYREKQNRLREGMGQGYRDVYRTLSWLFRAPGPDTSRLEEIRLNW